MQDSNSLLIEFDTESLTPQQVRLVKSLNMILGELLTSHTEHEYFECAQLLFSIAASLIQNSPFPNDMKKLSNIQYSDQAIEYAMDKIQEVLGDGQITPVDQ
jgi:endonuclease III-like uncharacterized protein